MEDVQLAHSRPILNYRGCLVNIVGMGIPAGFARVLSRVRVRVHEFVPVPVPVPAALICPNLGNFFFWFQQR
jgi:hypothetical protein